MKNKNKQKKLRKTEKVSCFKKKGGWRLVSSFIAFLKSPAEGSKKCCTGREKAKPLLLNKDLWGGGCAPTYDNYCLCLFILSAYVVVYQICIATFTAIVSVRLMQCDCCSAIISAQLFQCYCCGEIGSAVHLLQ